MDKKKEKSKETLDRTSINAKNLFIMKNMYSPDRCVEKRKEVPKLSLELYSKEQLQEMSFIEIAYEYLKNSKQAISFSELMDEIAKALKLSEQEVRAKIAQFYTDLNIDGRFLALGGNRWGLRVWYPVDTIEEEVVAAAKPKKKKAKKVVDEDEMELDDFEEAEEDYDYDDLDDFTDEEDELLDDEEDESFDDVDDVEDVDNVDEFEDEEEFDLDEDELDEDLDEDVTDLADTEEEDDEEEDR